MPLWEYKTHNAIIWTEASLNELGREGWELVTFNQTLLVFKRPLPAKIETKVDISKYEGD